MEVTELYLYIARGDVAGLAMWLLVNEQKTAPTFFVGGENHNEKLWMVDVWHIITICRHIHVLS